MREFKDSDIVQERMWGIVTKYDKERGFGFIKSKVDGHSYFAHVSQIQDGTLERGYLVEFGVGISKKTDREPRRGSSLRRPL